MGRIQAKQGLEWLLASVNCFILLQTANEFERTGSTTTGNFRYLCPNLNLETVFAALILAQNCCLYYNVNIFSEKLVI